MLHTRSAQTVPMEVLLVEDNMGDVELTQEALAEASIPIHTHNVGDGEQALAFLYRRAPYTDAIRPDLILLDLNMPRKSGQDVLRIVKQDEALRDIPIIMLTSSEAPQDIRECYQLYANAYVVKPMDIAQLHRMIALIEQFWLQLVALPLHPGKRR